MTRARDLAAFVSNADGDIKFDTDTLFIDSSTNRVGLGTSTPDTTLDIESATPIIRLKDTDTNAYSEVSASSGDGNIFIKADEGNGVSASGIRFHIDGSHVGRFQGTAFFLGKTSSGIANAGGELRDGDSDYAVLGASDGYSPFIANRNTNEGKIMVFRQANSDKGNIGVNGGSLYIGGGDVGLAFYQVSEVITPVDASNGNAKDNSIKLGFASGRFTEIFALNNSINTSDEREKQNIASLTDTEITAAKAISKLFKTYKWKDAVAAKGDNARTHTGVIAQQVETAMSDAGLTASNYSFWCSDTWWESNETYTDDDGVEQTRLSIYQTEDEAPEGATERNRKGIRYPELLSFIGAATEQRLTSIEARLDALEA